MPVVRGVDGCRGGWVAADLNVDALTVSWSWRSLAETASVLAAPAKVVAIDVPIGLPERGARACDGAARRLLGRRGVSVFAAPIRPVLVCASYAEARLALAALGGASMSAQAFGIVAAVRAVEAAVSVDDSDRVIECHPEVAFALMGGGPGLPSKKSAAGAAARLALLRSWLPTASMALAARPARVPIDDALDALACAWSATRWHTGAATVLGDGSVDARGLPMRIVA